MNKIKVESCPVCKSLHNRFYITTKAMMHKKNNEVYNFNLCNFCETVFLTNPVSEDKLNNYYTHHYLPYKGAAAWGKFAAFVERSQNNLDVSRMKLVKNALDKISTETKILDIGCGNPSFLAVVKKKLNITCTGIDFSDEGWLNKNYDDLNLIKVAIEDFQTDELFDVITLWHYLEHDYSPQKTIDKLCTLLKPGGKVIIEVPNYKSITAKKQKQFWQGWHSPRHISLFSKKSFEVLFDDKKWQSIQHKRYGTLDAFTLWWLGKMEQNNIDWSLNMQNQFFKLVFLKAVTFPIFVFEKIFPFGIQTIVAEKK